MSAKKNADTKKTASKPKHKKSSKPSKTRFGLTFAYASALLAVILVIGGWITFNYATKSYSGDEKWLYIPRYSEKTAIRDSLTAFDPEFGNRVYKIWDIISSDHHRASGAYKITNGTTALALARRIRTGSQTPVKVTFHNIRTMDQLAEKVTANLNISERDFLDACDTILSLKGFKKNEYPAAFIPDTYEFYWDVLPYPVIRKLFKEHEKFWTDDRKAKAEALGLTPVEVATIASIVEEETSKADERPLVARLYMNRLKKNMPLQADPTVKFALGDFNLRRIYKQHLGVRSPYNTYVNKGLPPGPIRVVTRNTIDDVLNAPEHNYLYMCAKEDFSGYHNFATDFASHQANARRYQAALNKRGIL
ncbi:MAG: endolytic transglycosylase MltG [Muribaculaceae bacterium]|nr:endolytic transglycosylase MltG [Muribaculaceae bacterium]